jgi:uncharacterized membrane protein
VFNDKSFLSIIWRIIHQKDYVKLGSDFYLGVMYPVLPWIGVILLGYCFGRLYQKGFDPTIRHKWLISMGWSAVILFFILRGINSYGDLHPWSYQKDFVFTVLSFFKVNKYPPSLLYVLITLGPALLILSVSENISNRFTKFIIIFGKVPMFYYFIHILVIHVGVTFVLLVTGGDLSLTILNNDLYDNHSAKLMNHGYSLWVVYLIWIALIFILYPICRWYMNYKFSNKDKWWLSYL